MNVRALDSKGRVRALTLVLAVALTGSAALAAGGKGAGAEGAHGEGAHGDSHHQSFNWFHGFLGEREGVEPGLLWRAPGTPVPFGAMMVNYGLLYYVLFRFARRPIQDALKKRKATLMQGIAEASRMRDEAAAQLKDGEQKLQGIEDQIVEVKEEIRGAAHAERTRVLREAEEKRARMERDAKVLVEQELKAQREQLHRETVASAVRSAEAALRARMGGAEHERLQKDYLGSIEGLLKNSSQALSGGAS